MDTMSVNKSVTKQELHWGFTQKTLELRAQQTQMKQLTLRKKTVREKVLKVSSVMCGVGAPVERVLKTGQGGHLGFSRGPAW